MFGLKEKHVDAINTCFAQYEAIDQVVLFGSRAKGTYKNGSDIDLSIVGNLTYDHLLKLENQLDDLLLPYKIDLSLKRQISNADLIAHIDRVGKVFYDKTLKLSLNEPHVRYMPKEEE
jgi:predicted nucleotidyltransferase